MMIIHHQGAIDMSKVEIAKGEDRQIRHMARKIIRKQKDEIEQLRDFIKNYELLNLENNNTEMHNELIEIMEDMMIKMESMQMTGDIDRDFARMMILHHRSAIKMAKSELSHGKQIELKEMAIKMIEDQKKEINKFKLWLSEQ
jgi:uncharacterized protein (DUF305 family)